KLAVSEMRNVDAPNVSPAIRLRVEVDDFARLSIFDVVIEQNSHFLCGAAEDHKLDAVIVDNRSVGQEMRELELRVNVSHEHGAGPRVAVKHSGRVDALKRITARRNLRSNKAAAEQK